AVQLVGLVSLDLADALGFQLRAHWRIDAGVATRHGVARAAREHCQTAHERAADAEDVDVHKPVVPRGRFFCEGMEVQKRPERPPAKDPIVTDRFGLAVSERPSRRLVASARAALAARSSGPARKRAVGNL